MVAAFLIFAVFLVIEHCGAFCPAIMNDIDWTLSYGEDSVAGDHNDIDFLMDCSFQVYGKAVAWEFRQSSSGSFFVSVWRYAHLHPATYDCVGEVEVSTNKSVALDGSSLFINSQASGVDVKEGDIIGLRSHQSILLYSIGGLQVKTVPRPPTLSPNTTAGIQVDLTGSTVDRRGRFYPLSVLTTDSECLTWQVMTQFTSPFTKSQSATQPPIFQLQLICKCGCGFDIYFGTTLETLYSITFGLTTSVRESGGHQPIASEETPGFLSGDAWQKLWVFQSGDQISIGQGGKVDPILTFTAQQSVSFRGLAVNDSCGICYVLFCEAIGNFCLGPISLSKGIRTKEPDFPNSDGSRITYACTGNYALLGPKTVRCVGSQWTRMPYCMEYSVETPTSTKQVGFGEKDFGIANFQLQDELIFNMTMCFWLKRLDRSDATIFSYMSPTSEEELHVTTPFEIWMKGKRAPSLELPFDTQWQHFCMKYFHVTGNLKLLVGGKTRLTEWGFSYKQTFSGEGSLIIGQRQDSFAHIEPGSQGGHFMLSEFNIWNDVIYLSSVMKKMADCSLGVDREQGNFIMWNDVIFLSQEIPKVYEMRSMCTMPELQLEIRCVSNCGPKVVFSASLSVYIRCLDCRGDESPSYRWTLSSSNGKIDNLPEKTETGVTGVGLEIAANTLPMSTNFVLTAIIETAEGNVIISQYQFITEYPPSGGNCSISPSEGNALQTPFFVDCSGWRVSPTCSSLSYEVWIRDNVTIPSDSYEIIHVGARASTPAFYLVPGDPSKNYLIDVMVRICDDTGECTAQHYNIKAQVESPFNVMTIHGKLESDDSCLKCILEEDPTEAIGFIFLMSNNVNQMTSDKTMSEAEIAAVAEIRETLTDGLLEATSTEVDINGMSILQRAIALKSVSSYSNPKELSLTTQIKVADTWMNIASAFEGKQGQGEIQAETATSIVEELIQAADNILSALDAAVKSKIIFEEPEFSQEAKLIVEKTLAALNSTLSTALNTMLPGQPRRTYQTDIIEVQLMKSESSMHVETQFISKYGTLKVPMGLLDIEDNLKPISTKFIALARNPFFWSSESYLLDSPIFLLEMLYESGQSVSTVQTTDSDSHLEVAIVKESPIDTTDSREPSNKAWANFHDFEIAGTQTYMLEVNVPADNSVMLISVATNQTTAALLLYIHSDNYQFNTSLAWNETLNVDEGMRQVVIGPFGDAARYTLAMELGKGAVSKERAANQTNVFMGKIAVSIQVCRYYDTTREMWASEGCKVSLSATKDRIVCKCDRV